MSTRERRQRDILERERRFLAAARALICRDGFLNLQMAKVAERCDYAVGTLYQHFVSKEDLLVALAGEAAQERVKLFRKVSAWKASTRERMLGFAAADMVCMRRYPENFRVLQFALTEAIWGAAPVSRRQACMDGNRPLRELPEAVIAEAIERGDLPRSGLSVSELCFGPWALTLGSQMILNAEGLLDAQQIHHPYRLMLRHVNDLLNGLQWKPRVDAAETATLDAFAERISNEVLHEQVAA